MRRLKSPWCVVSPEFHLRAGLQEGQAPRGKENVPHGYLDVREFACTFSEIPGAPRRLPIAILREEFADPTGALVEDRFKVAPNGESVHGSSEPEQRKAIADLIADKRPSSLSLERV